MLIRDYLLKVWRKCNTIQNPILSRLVRRVGPLFLPSSLIPKTLIISPGGVGTTFLMEHVKQYRNLNCTGDTDWLKHLPFVPKHWITDPQRKILFVYDKDPNSPYLSLKRRNWLEINNFKISGRRMHEVDFAEFRKNYLRQLNNFKNISRRYPNQILLVEYDQLWDCKYEIADFLSVDKEFGHSFPVRRRRLSQK